jgi:hypothetical protein
MKRQIAPACGAWLGMAALLASLQACGSPSTEGVGPTSGGNPFDKTIEVVVSANVISVPESTANVPAGQPGVVKWKFASGTSGYRFPAASSTAPGIVFKRSAAAPPQGCMNAPDPATIFHNCDAKQGGSEFHCNAKKSNAGDCYAYTVTVVPANSGAPVPPPLDPWIRSQ